MFFKFEGFLFSLAAGTFMCASEQHSTSYI